MEHLHESLCVRWDIFFFFFFYFKYISFLLLSLTLSSCDHNDQTLLSIPIPVWMKIKFVRYLMMLIWIVSISKICWITTYFEFESIHAMNNVIVIDNDRGGMRRSKRSRFRIYIYILHLHTPTHNQLIDIDIFYTENYIRFDSIWFDLMKR